MSLKLGEILYFKKINSIGSTAISKNTKVNYVELKNKTKILCH